MDSRVQDDLNTRIAATRAAIGGLEAAGALLAEALRLAAILGRLPAGARRVTIRSSPRGVRDWRAIATIRGSVNRREALSVALRAIKRLRSRKRFGGHQGPQDWELLAYTDNQRVRLY